MSHFKGNQISHIWLNLEHVDADHFKLLYLLISFRFKFSISVYKNNFCNFHLKLQPDIQSNNRFLRKWEGGLNLPRPWPLPPRPSPGSGPSSGRRSSPGWVRRRSSSRILRRQTLFRPMSCSSCWCCWHRRKSWSWEDFYLPKCNSVTNLAMRKTQLKYKMTTLGSHDKDILSPLGELDLILLFQLSSSKTGVTLITKKIH